LVNFNLIFNGKAKPYPPSPEEKVSPEAGAKRLQDVLNSGPYKVEITRFCFVGGYRCESREIVFLKKDDATTFLHSPYGKVIAVPPEEEGIEDKVSLSNGRGKYAGCSGEETGAGIWPIPATGAQGDGKIEVPQRLHDGEGKPVRVQIQLSAPYQ